MDKPIKAEYGAPDRPLNIGDIKIPCYVLEDGKRVITQRGFQEALGMSTGGGKGGARKIPQFMDNSNVKPLINSDLRVRAEELITFKTPNGSTAFGYDAVLLQEFVRAISKAYLKGILHPNQRHIGERAEKLDDGFSRVGIIALIDEVTGYQNVRVKNALEEILNKYLLPEAKQYKVTYPLELYKQWFRLNNWEWREESARKKPVIIGKWTNDFIYGRMAPGLLEKLERINPKNEKGYRQHKHFSFLSDEIGEPKLLQFFGGLIALARATTNWRKYTEMIERAYPKFGDNPKLDLPEDES